MRLGIEAYGVVEATLIEHQWRPLPAGCACGWPKWAHSGRKYARDNHPGHVAEHVVRALREQT